MTYSSNLSNFTKRPTYCNQETLPTKNTEAGSHFTVISDRTDDFLLSHSDLPTCILERLPSDLFGRILTYLAPPTFQNVKVSRNLKISLEKGHPSVNTFARLEIAASCVSSKMPMGLNSYETFIKLGISSFPQIFHLQLWVANKQNNRRMNDQKFKDIISKFPNLKALYIPDLQQISNLGLQNIGIYLSQLEILNLSGNNTISSAGLQSITHLPLRDLTLSSATGSSPITDHGLSMLGKISTLKRLNLNECIHITDVGIAALKNLKLLRLTLEECDRITDLGLRELGEMTSLQELSIGGVERYNNPPKITEEGVRDILGKLPKLKLTLAMPASKLNPHQRSILRTLGVIIHRSPSDW